MNAFIISKLYNFFFGKCETERRELAILVTVSKPILELAPRLVHFF